ncbi:MAG: 50S ribosomal protein L20 [Candidatus Daviesbacteria bacterium GW2011_GWA1_41_61]|uniref:Large ribosomal subunit protein bL20 n=1 Tax=Candidatus Daviesbacteria bacterium GW2011_GWA2_40_9 TaxID=1618424 RepID=A0A0G0U3Y1_9BACT|nr:MAG: 50S ribosomal protein L20 [Candidatus Daviesbacteria bacterium GW2011_GWA2_40_9]KKR93407.1 MAG: 50S ribosomal protein L20 [Candidatus Daviesbacteria bacterium GW2011_GWB1_41_15]KKS15044.1 MAG: 50S ribosomal protein L20 [Candidatus Daviesbacteria bacterium GW2011_GWA1_41_61]
MARVKRGVTSHKKHKKLLNLTKGYQGHRSKLIRQAKESSLHAGQYAFAGRKQRRRDMRKLWITQMGIALKQEGVSYSKFISDLNTKNITLDRKILAEIAVKDLPTFKKIVSEVK